MREWHPWTLDSFHTPLTFAKRRRTDPHIAAEIDPTQASFGNPVDARAPRHSEGEDVTSCLVRTPGAQL